MELFYISMLLYAAFIIQLTHSKPIGVGLPHDVYTRSSVGDDHVQSIVCSIENMEEAMVNEQNGVPPCHKVSSTFLTCNTLL